MNANSLQINVLRGMIALSIGVALSACGGGSAADDQENISTAATLVEVPAPTTTPLATPTPAPASIPAVTPTPFPASTPITTPATTTPATTTTATPATVPTPAPSVASVTTPPSPSDDALMSNSSRIRFLTQATFGATPAVINDTSITSAADWLVTQFSLPPTYNLPIFERYQRQYPPIADDEFAGELMVSPQVLNAPPYAFWINAISAQDQLRQRMVYALSQLLVVSSAGGEELFDNPNAIIYYQDLLTRHALGNFRDLLEAVTYSPAMGHYLTYMGNQKGDPVTGRMPDENYAREILQLFTIGLVALNQDGTPITDSNGNLVELYDNKDITGLARVFTGLNVNEEVDHTEADAEPMFELSWAAPMEMFEGDHSPLEKSFLGFTIPANSSGQQSIKMALDHIFNHPNVAPFISRQLIQRFVTSHPAPDYVSRVAAAFETGTYPLPNGISVGENRRGDLRATIAAILMDQAARQPSHSNTFGKLREPVIRIANWARAFNVKAVKPELRELFEATFTPETLNQQPYAPKSVFNFYRPGYVAPGTLSGSAGLTTPELQITNASSITGYTNFLNELVIDRTQFMANEAITEAIQAMELGNANVAVADFRNSFSPDYSSEQALAANPAALLDRLDLLLTFGSLTNTMRQRITDAISRIPLDEPDAAQQRVYQAILMVMTSPEYLVQQ